MKSPVRIPRYFAPMLFMLLLSCEGLDGGHIPAKKMERIIVDISLAEVYSGMVKYDSASKYQPGMHNLDSLAYFHKEIFRHYRVSAKQFKESMEWYERNPEQMDSIINHVTEILADSGKRYDVSP